MVNQPYHYVGISTTIRQMGLETDPPTLVRLYSNQKKEQVIATLAAGSEIEVLLADGNHWYLARTSFGLVGWITNGGDIESPFGLRYAGD